MKASVEPSQPYSTTTAMERNNVSVTGKKRKSEPQVGVSTPTQDAKQTPPPPKKKIKASVAPSQPYSTTTAMERNKHGAPSHNAKKRPTADESDDASVNAHPVKKAKVEKLRRSGKIILNF
jgi:hypothetical protein